MPAERGDFFWARRTEDAGGLIQPDSELPGADDWRRFRLTQELADRWYRRAGIGPDPVDNLDLVEIGGIDCDLGPRSFGPLDETDPALDWDGSVTAMERNCGLAPLAAEAGHETCFHTRVYAAFPLMWQVGLALLEPEPDERTLTTASFAEVVEEVESVAEYTDEIEQQNTWIIVWTSGTTIALSPTGWAYVDEYLLDLAVMHRVGRGIGELAAAVEDLIKWQELTPDARRWQHLMRLCEHAGLPTARLMPKIEIPDEVMIFASDEQLIVIADLDASPETVDAALAFGLGFAHDQDINVVIPAGRQERTLRRAAYLNVRVRVWVHDGYRIAPVVVPARDEVRARLRAETWAPYSARKDGWDPFITYISTPGLVRVRHDSPWGSAVVTLRPTMNGLIVYHPLFRVTPESVLDCLDQMMWVQALREQLMEYNGGGSSGPLQHQLLADNHETGRSLHPLHPAQLEAIDAGRVTIVLLDRDHDPVGKIRVKPFCPPAVMPERPAPTRSSLRRWRTMLAHSGGSTDYWRDPACTILPLAQNAWPVTALTPDRMFAFNIFAPIGAAGAARVLKTLGLAAIRAEEPVFAYSELAGDLGLVPVDVLLRGSTADDRSVAALFMVRLTDEEFAACPGYLDPANTHRDTCRTGAPFGGSLSTCHLLGPEVKEAPPVTAEPTADGGCPFRRNNEPMRLLALAETFLDRRRYDRVAVVLCAPAFEESIQRRLAEAQKFRSASGLSVDFLPVEVLLSITKHPATDQIRSRYGIGNAERVAAPG